RSACRQAQIDAATVRCRVGCAGFSGGPADKEGILRDLLRADSLQVTTDAVVALAGATAREPGIITIAGTGSISYGRNRAGQFARAGGWGYIFGDEGGAFDITRQALRAVLRNEEGWGPPTLLRDSLLQETGATDANDLMHLFYTPEFPRPLVASYAQIVNRAAADGDAVARNILLNAAQQLAGITSAVHGQLFSEGEPCQVAYIGGVFQSELLLERFRILVELDGGSTLIPPMYGPAVGALLEAYASAGLNATLSNVPESEK
ncbi:MAG TPA: BadF/BadG/BcrA/BcrD ATPase family protein, partial [Bryobacteraceae bacterium]|nr:BadF/BadG/BcrA/BcrD ATPase family protein [Bryobacteraceae bacterium]